jgi:EmrB/QacA subfamily drug resistance transporter
MTTATASMTRTQSWLIIAGLMLGTALAALDTTVVGTAMPTIIGKLGGISLYSWVFSAYLLTSTTTVPVYGKLADLYGRKPVFLVGVAIFLAGSVLCGLSQSMVQLVIFRAVQGIGAGAVLPVTMTIIGDLFSIQERARIGALFSGVWGVSSIAGPALGGLITDYVGWRWVFYVNLPVGLVSAGLIMALLHERVEHRRRQIDYLGSATLTAGITALLLGLLQGGDAWAWTSPESLATFGAAALLLAVFLWNEARVPEPVLPLSLFKNRIITVASIAGALSGAAMFGVTSFVPLFVQGVEGGTATDAGMVVAPMSIGWPAGSIIAGRLIVRFGYRPATLIGGVCLLLGGLLLALVDEGTSRALFIVLLVLVGLGLGFTSSAFVIAIQNAVPWSQRGVATATSQFFRTIGGSIGVAVLGAVLASQWAARAAVATVPDIDRSALLDPERRAQIPAETLAAVQSSLAGALHVVFLLVTGLTVLVFLAVLFFPRGSAEDLAADTSSERAVPPPAHAGRDDGVAGRQAEPSEVT